MHSHTHTHKDIESLIDFFLFFWVLCVTFRDSLVKSFIVSSLNPNSIVKMTECPQIVLRSIEKNRKGADGAFKKDNKNLRKSQE